MGIKKWTDSLNESSKIGNVVGNLQDALVTISDDWGVIVQRDDQHFSDILVKICGSSQNSFYNRRSLGGHDRLSLNEIEQISIGMSNSSKVIDLFLEGLNRSGVEHDNIKIDIQEMVMYITITLIR